MTTFKQIASNCFFDDDDHTDTLHIDKKIQQGKRYKTTGELDLEKAKEIDCEVEKVERTYTKPQVKNFEISDVEVLKIAKLMDACRILKSRSKKYVGGGDMKKVKNK